jgi:hypothetical protein
MPDQLPELHCCLKSHPFHPSMGMPMAGGMHGIGSGRKINSWHPLPGNHSLWMIDNLERFRTYGAMVI